LPQDVADKFGAKCLNGDAPTFEIIRNSSSSSWVLFLEGGGWCYGVTEDKAKTDCAHKGGFVWPPTSEASQEMLGEEASTTSADKGGIMSQDPLVNPDFHTWNKVFMHYCDRSSFGGSRTDPIAVSTPQGTPAKLWMRGRNNFDGLVSYLQTDLGMGDATEVILSGGSAGGLAVFYNLDHLATLLPEGVRLTGFPDAGFFLDAQNVQGEYLYRSYFQSADPVWNVTGSGGTNLKCLAAHTDEKWKCLMAPYIAPHIETPFFVMNSAYDAWQMSHVLQTQCIPAPNRGPCSADQNATMQSFHDKFVKDIASVTDGKPKNGVYVDSCYVHEQNVNYCSNQGMPNCVGWSPLETGSKKWGYNTTVKVGDGRSLTPQQAFGAYYRGDRVAAVAVDENSFFDNPGCFYLGQPVPPAPPPPSPICGDCCDFTGDWVDDPTWLTPKHFSQDGCNGSFEKVNFSVQGDVMTTSNNFHGGLTAQLFFGFPRDEIHWSNGYTWERKHSGRCDVTSFSGHHCSVALTNLSSAAITTAEECSAAACDWHLHVGFNVTYIGFNDAEQSCFVGDWRRSPSCRRDSKWTTFLVNYEGATWESNHASVALI